MKKTLFFCIGLTISASLFAAPNSNVKKTVKKTAEKKVETKAETKKSTSNANAKKETKDKRNTGNTKSTDSKTESKKGSVNSKNSKSNSIKDKKTSSSDSKSNSDSKKETGSKKSHTAANSKNAAGNSKNTSVSSKKETKEKNSTSTATKTSTKKVHSTVENKKTVKETKIAASKSSKAEAAVSKNSRTETARNRTETVRRKNSDTVSGVKQETRDTPNENVKTETRNQKSTVVTNLHTMYENSSKDIKDEDVKARNVALAETFEKEIEERSQYTHFQTGMASFYGGSWHGKKTANDEIFNENSLTAAHRTLPFGTRVRVTNLDNGKSVVVRINNRGPYSNGRIIDLSKAAFSRIASTSRGVTRVKLEVSK